MPSVMVCVTTQRACERLIEAGSAAAKPSGSPLHVVHVTGSRQHFFNAADEALALEYLFDVSKKHDAEMSVLRSDDVAKTIADYAKEHHVQLIIFGQSGDGNRPGNVISRVEHMLDGAGISIAVQNKTE